jgi:site-specific DNA-methyltransferase (adenine-specific)
VLFQEKTGEKSAAQITAFEDTWHWGVESEYAYQELVKESPKKLADLIQAFRMFLSQNDMMAYLVMMTIRLVELHRVLKPTGSLYLHCDRTEGHYLKIVMDQIFSPVNFRNEIIWKRTSAHSDSRVFGKTHDTILYYTKSEDFTHIARYQEYDEKYTGSHYRFKDKKGRVFRTDNLTAKGLTGGGYEYEWHGVQGLWRYPIERMKELENQGRIRYTKSGMPEYVRYLDEMPGIPAQDVWNDIPPINSQAKERLGYETQKPVALLERIIQASSNEGDVVLDPFCGCGTAVVAAQKLNRKWIGIDITHLAINLMRNRLKDSFPGIRFEVIGEPKDLSGAKELAHQKDRYQFQWWALGLIGARPAGDKKKGADQGIDGVIPFIDNPAGKASRVVVQVKSGHIGVNAVRELIAVAAREAICVLITLEPPSAPMVTEAVSAGLYHSPLYDRDYSKIQILTIEELLQGKTVDMPPQTQTSIAFPKATRVKNNGPEQGNMIYDVRRQLPSKTREAATQLYMGDDNEK